jgi:hypothetical protein
MKRAAGCGRHHASQVLWWSPLGYSVRYSDRRAIQAIGRIDRGADQKEGLNRTLLGYSLLDQIDQIYPKT